MKVRFAPSPTGELHVGGARTALYNYLLARQSGGEFVLRIEDTDRERSTPENVDQILDALKWLGLEWDLGPVSQFECRDSHQNALERLVADGHAYRSSATAEDTKRYREQTGRGYRGEPDADGTEAAVRLLVPAEAETVVEDIIRGSSAFENRLLDDFVIARSDGTPLYNFAVAVDDTEMEITHVVRGEDHFSNTARQLLVMEALGATPPKYAHLPLLHGPDGKKLSKRHGAASVQELRQAGFLPEAVINYLALLGWGYDDKTTFFSRQELIEKFSLERVSNSPAVFDIKKLSWMNGQYIRQLGVEELAAQLTNYLSNELGITKSADQLTPAASITQEKIATLADFWPLAKMFFEKPGYDREAWQKVFKDGQGTDDLKAARDCLAGLEDFNSDQIEAALRAEVEARGVKPKQLFQPLRVAISGTTVSAGLFESLELLGKAESLERIDLTIETLTD